MREKAESCTTSTLKERFLRNGLMSRILKSKSVMIVRSERSNEKSRRHRMYYDSNFLTASAKKFFKTNSIR
jgi:hypothetical protein